MSTRRPVSGFKTCRFILLGSSGGIGGENGRILTRVDGCGGLYRIGTSLGDGDGRTRGFVDGCVEDEDGLYRSFTKVYVLVHLSAENVDRFAFLEISECEKPQTSPRDSRFSEFNTVYEPCVLIAEA